MTTATPILMLTTRTGGGHVNLARSLTEALGDAYRVEVVDPYWNVVHTGYAQWSRYDTRFWGLMYRLSDHRATSLVAHTLLTRLIQRRLTAILARSDCELILTTHPWLSYEVGTCLKRLRRPIPLAFQITDLAFHHMWSSYRDADLYLASTEDIYAGLLAQGIEPRRVRLTGRPVRAQFLADYAPARHAILESLGFDPSQPTVFVQGGAEGSADLRATLDVIASLPRAPQVILATGHNERLRQRYSGVAGVKTLPFVDDIARYMAASDLIIGKPGASYLTQAFMLARPFMATTYIHGHEAPNLRFIERYNLGWVCLTPGEQRQVLAALLADRGALAAKAESARRYRDLNLTWMRQISPAIHDLLDESASFRA